MVAKKRVNADRPRRSVDVLWFRISIVHFVKY